MANPIGWCDRTVNPVFGCRNGCSYCYARALAPRVAAMRAAATGQPICDACRTFTPHLHPERLQDIGKGRGQVVFIGSMCDLWSDGVEQKWRDCLWTPIIRSTNQFVILTKRPERMVDEDAVPHLWGAGPIPNIWLGVSVVDKDYRALLQELQEKVPGNRCIVSAEPLLGPIYPASWAKETERPAWLIVGPQTGPGAVPPERAWVQDLIDYADEYQVPLWLKSGCYELWPDMPVRQERPPAMVEACETAKAGRVGKTRRS